MSVFGDDRRDESIAAPVRRLDETGGLRVVAERPAHVANRAFQHGLTHEDVRPDGVEELLLRDEASGARGEVLEQREGLGRERDGRAAAQQFSAFGIEAELGKGQNLRRGHDGDVNG